MNTLTSSNVERVLQQGFICAHGASRQVTYRFLASSDDLLAITELLHAAYAPLAEAGMRYVASHQTVDVTTSRMARGDTIVAVVDGHIVGVVTLSRAVNTKGSPHYDRPDVASFGQFAVAPAHHGAGVGSALMTIVERLASAQGVSELALDTSREADHLIRYYTSRGYRFIETVRWSVVNYESVIMSKALPKASGDI